MSRVYFISDLHLGHKNIMGFAGQYRHGNTYEENAQSIIEMWNLTVRKQDKVFVLGDVAFGEEYLEMVAQLKGIKILIRGNHDDRISTKSFLKHFKEVYGIYSYKRYWLTHAPIHPHELRGKINIHGHVHQNSILDVSILGHPCDPRYINVCIENTGGAPVSYESIRDGDRGWLHWIDADGRIGVRPRHQLKG